METEFALVLKHHPTADNQVEIWFSDTEIGWARKLGDTNRVIYRIETISLETDVSWGDIVEAKEIDGKLKITSTMHRLFKWKECIFYDNEQQEEIMRHLAEEMQSHVAHMEVYRKPNPLEGLRGALLFAFDDDFSPLTAAKIAGIKEPQEVICGSQV